MFFPYKIGGGVMPESRYTQFLPEEHEFLVATWDIEVENRPAPGLPLSVSMWILGYIDLTTGERRDAKDILIWMPTEEEQRGEVFKELFRELTVYRVKGHPPVKYKGMISGIYVTEIVRAHVRDAFLSGLIREYCKWRYLRSEMFGTMSMKDEYEAYWAWFDWLGTEIEVEVSAEYEPYTEPLGHLEAFCREAERHDRELRDFAAERLIGEVNELISPEGGEELTEQELAGSLKIRSVTMYYDGDYDVYFELQGRHGVSVNGGPDGPKDAYLWRNEYAYY